MSTFNISSQYSALDNRYAAVSLAQNAAKLWTANTAYTNGQIVIGPDGSIIKANSSFTSGATYSAANWTALANSPTQGVNTLGSANNPVTSASASRPTGLTKVFWQCPTQPTNWLAGDEWINNA